MPQREAVRPGTVVLTVRCFARKGDNKAKSSSQFFPFPKYLQVCHRRPPLLHHVHRQAREKTSLPLRRVTLPVRVLVFIPRFGRRRRVFSVSAVDGSVGWERLRKMAKRLGGWRWGNDEYSSPGPERTERRKCAVNTRRRTKEQP